MGGSTLLQIFLLLNVFIMGILAAIAYRHGMAHFRPEKHSAEKPHPAVHPVHLPPAVKERLLERAETHFQSILDHSASELQRDLTKTSEQLNKQLQKLGLDVVTSETKRYEAMLDKLQNETEGALSTAQLSIAQQQTTLEASLAEQKTQLEAKLREEVAAEKEQLIKQIDTKLADAVASFLTETLQHNVDLGAQSAYLTATLDEHKDELVKGMRDEA